MSLSREDYEYLVSCIEMDIHEVGDGQTLKGINYTYHERHREFLQDLLRKLTIRKDSFDEMRRERVGSVLKQVNHNE